MKCRACWADKAYVRDVRGWKAAVATWLGLVPLKCHHCYHRFWTFGFLTFGKALTPPLIKAARVEASTPAVILRPVRRDEVLVDDQTVVAQKLVAPRAARKAA